jgi:hypothetical protein
MNHLKEVHMHRSRSSLVSLCSLAAILALILMLPPATQAFFRITIYFGKPGRCEGFGFCKIVVDPNKSVDQAAARRRILEGKAGEANASISEDSAARTAGTNLRIEMSTAVPNKASSLPVDEDVVLDAETSKSFGYRSVTVIRGEYKIDYTKNKFGTVVVKVKAEGRSKP